MSSNKPAPAGLGLVAVWEDYFSEEMDVGERGTMDQHRLGVAYTENCRHTSIFRATSESNFLKV